MTIKTMIFTHQPCVPLARFTFCWWRHNRLLMKSQWPDNCDTITWIVISNSLDIDFINRAIFMAGHVRNRGICNVCINHYGNESFFSTCISYATPDLDELNNCLYQCHLNNTLIILNTFINTFASWTSQSYRVVSARKTWLQCVSNGVTSFLHWPIHMIHQNETSLYTPSIISWQVFINIMTLEGLILRSGDIYWHNSAGHVNHYWDYYSGVPIKSLQFIWRSAHDWGFVDFIYGARFSNELQRLDHMTGHLPG